MCRHFFLWTLSNKFSTILIHTNRDNTPPLNMSKSYGSKRVKSHYLTTMTILYLLFWRRISGWIKVQGRPKTKCPPRKGPFTKSFLDSYHVPHNVLGSKQKIIYMNSLEFSDFYVINSPSTHPSH